MGLILEHVVPWGRSFDEYAAMFALLESDLMGRILSCADGPAGFNAGMRERGRKIVSADPIYVLSPDAIRSRIDATCAMILEQVHKHREDYIWNAIPSPDELRRVRIAAMETFLDDLPRGAREGRYVAAAAPFLPFRTGTFDMALCSHFLFTYSDLLSAEFHLDAALEMCRVADQVRIFPLLDTSGVPSPHVDHVHGQLAARGYVTSIRTVPYEFQVGGNQMMVITNRR